MNSLQYETSPYLLQHANNPVDWRPWSKDTLQLAKKLNKPLLISIGYSSCHWCHVMERESFENHEVAELMNDNFVCIKIDREERPDIDQIYMEAVQLLTGSGGWPLNCFALPDGRPFWGGTYFPKQKWISILRQIHMVFNERFYSLRNQADRITQSIREGNLLKGSFDFNELKKEDIIGLYSKLSKKFDFKNGGELGAPKFPMPSTLNFVLHYYHHTKDNSALEHLEHTLRKMALGGIYDCVGGGFSRYAVDEQWIVPHFEKMLYDNAQLISLYSQMYRITGRVFYKDVATEIFEFVKQEMTGINGEFYSALDADSEGEEGLYYVWTEDELERNSGDDSELFLEYYNIQADGNWEKGRNILYAKLPIADFAAKKNVDTKELQCRFKNIKENLLAERSKRVRPGLDYKALSSWNAMMVKGLLDTFIALKDDDVFSLAEKNLAFILDKMKAENGGLLHSFAKGEAKIEGFLEDHAFVIEALIKMYSVTFKEEYLFQAKELSELAIAKFYDPKDSFFYFADHTGEHTIARKKELHDNVMPSSNSSMMRSLSLLGLVFENENFLQIVSKATKQIKTTVLGYPSAFANWGILFLEKAFPFYTAVVSGESSRNVVCEIQEDFLPNVFVINANGSSLPIAKEKCSENTQIWLCDSNSCKAPVNTVEELMTLIVKS